jgi:hypothetical protein
VAAYGYERFTHSAFRCLSLVHKDDASDGEQASAAKSRLGTVHDLSGSANRQLMACSWFVEAALRKKWPQSAGRWS